MSSTGTLALSGTTLIGSGSVTDSGHLTTSNSSTALSSITMASGSTLNIGNFTVQPGATLSVSANASVTMGRRWATGTTTLADNGTVTFAAGRHGDPDADNGNYGFTTAQIVVGSGGLLKASRHRLQRPRLTNGGNYTHIIVNAGGTSRPATAPSPSATSTWPSASCSTRATWSATASTPRSTSPPSTCSTSRRGSNNLRFQAHRHPAGHAGQRPDVALNAIGTQTTTNLRYVFPGNLHRQPGGERDRRRPSRSCSRAG